MSVCVGYQMFRYFRYYCVWMWIFTLHHQPQMFPQFSKSSSHLRRFVFHPSAVKAEDLSSHLVLLCCSGFTVNPCGSAVMLLELLGLLVGVSCSLKASLWWAELRIVTHMWKNHRGCCCCFSSDWFVRDQSVDVTSLAPVTWPAAGWQNTLIVKMCEKCIYQ